MCGNGCSKIYENLKMCFIDFYVKYLLIFIICGVFVVICNIVN